MANFHTCAAELSHCEHILADHMRAHKLIPAHIFANLTHRLSAVVQANNSSRDRDPSLTQRANHIYKRLYKVVELQEAWQDDTMAALHPRLFRTALPTCYGWVNFVEHKTLLAQRVIKSSTSTNLMGGEDPRSEAVLYTLFSKDAHPGLMHPVAVSIFPRRVLLTTDYVGSGTLKQHLDADFLAVNRHLKQIFTSLCHTLDYMHNHLATSHLDLKPENILLDDHYNAIIFDLGMATQSEFAAFDGKNQNNTQDYDFQRCLYSAAMVTKHLCSVRENEQLTFLDNTDLQLPSFSVPFSHFFNTIATRLLHTAPASIHNDSQFIEELITSIDQVVGYPEPVKQQDTQSVSPDHLYRAASASIFAHINLQCDTYANNDALFQQHINDAKEYHKALLRSFPSQNYADPHLDADKSSAKLPGPVPTITPNSRVNSARPVLEKSHQPLLLFPLPLIFQLPCVVDHVHHWVDLYQQGVDLGGDQEENLCAQVSVYDDDPLPHVLEENNQRNQRDILWPQQALDRPTHSLRTTTFPAMQSTYPVKSPLLPTTASPDHHNRRPNQPESALNIISDLNPYQGQLAQYRALESPPLPADKCWAKQPTTINASCSINHATSPTPHPSNKTNISSTPTTASPPLPLYSFLQQSRELSQHVHANNMQYGCTTHVNDLPASAALLAPLPSSPQPHSTAHPPSHQPAPTPGSIQHEHHPNHFTPPKTITPASTTTHSARVAQHLILLHFLSTTFHHRSLYITLKPGTSSRILSHLTLSIDHFDIQGFPEGRGSLPYRAPENNGASPSARYSPTKADIYSLGLLLVRLMTNSMLYDRPTRQCPNFVTLCTAWESSWARAHENGTNPAFSHRHLVRQMIISEYPVYSDSLFTLLEDLLCPWFQYRPNIKQVIARIEQVDWTLSANIPHRSSSTLALNIRQTAPNQYDTPLQRAKLAQQHHPQQQHQQDHHQQHHFQQQWQHQHRHNVPTTLLPPFESPPHSTPFTSPTPVKPTPEPPPTPLPQLTPCANTIATRQQRQLRINQARKAERLKLAQILTPYPLHDHRRDNDLHQVSAQQQQRNHQHPPPALGLPQYHKQSNRLHKPLQQQPRQYHPASASSSSSYFVPGASPTPPPTIFEEDEHAVNDPGPGAFSPRNSTDFTPTTPSPNHNNATSMPIEVPFPLPRAKSHDRDPHPLPPLPTTTTIPPLSAQPQHRTLNQFPFVQHTPPPVNARPHKSYLTNHHSRPPANISPTSSPSWTKPPSK